MRKCFSFDKFRVVLAVTWAWAWVSLKITKLFELVFKMLLSMPNNWLTFLNDPVIKTLDGKSISILNAYNETGEITNKLKLFLRWYWENGGDGQPYETNGFDFRKYVNMLNSSLLYCSYLLTNQQNQNSDSTSVDYNPYEDICRFTITQNQLNYNMYRNEELTDPNELDLAHVDFLDNQPNQEMDEQLADEIENKLLAANNYQDDSPCLIRLANEIRNRDPDQFKNLKRGVPLSPSKIISVDMLKGHTKEEPLVVRATNIGSEYIRSVLDSTAVLKYSY